MEEPMVERQKTTPVAAAPISSPVASGSVCMGEKIRDLSPPPPCAAAPDDQDEVDVLGDIDIGGAADLIFSDDAFPSLPHFSCLSSPSCSSSFATCPSSTCSSSSSSSTSWSVAPAPVDDGPTTTPSGQNHQAGMESEGSVDLLAGMDLLDEDIWDDPSSLFPDEDPPPPLPPTAETLEEDADRQPSKQYPEGGSGGGHSEDLASVFLDWLKTNKETISPEDLRNIRLKRSTIESAARRLGGGREGMTQLLKLILAWVQNYQLQKKRLQQDAAAAAVTGGSDGGAAGYPYQHQNHHFPMIHIPVTSGGGAVPGQQEGNPNPNHSHVYSAMQLFDGACPSWQQPPSEPVAAGFYSGNGSGEAVYSSGGTAGLDGVDPISSWPLPTSTPYSPSPPPPPLPPQYPIFPSASATQYPPPMVPSPPYMGGYGAQYPMCPQFLRQGKGEHVVRMASTSATKEARKKRMARQRRFMSLHHHRNHQPPPLQQQQCASVPAASILWSASAAATQPATTQMAPSSTDRSANPKVSASHGNMHHQNHGRGSHSSASDRRQGWKSEKNLRFLLQKVLKQSDVGSLGRIVLPKKEAEIHLPELEARDGISITMEDIGTSRTWNMRYRFWPNNKSRMYLLENTGDFVRSNGLQEGDFIVIYSDVKCGKYMIRGVKVRNPSVDTKADGNKNHGKQAHHSTKERSDSPDMSSMMDMITWESPEGMTFAENPSSSV